jgi:hypothetical protein
MKSVALAKSARAIVTYGFEQAYGYKPTNITSLAGDPPSEKNGWLYMPALDLYQGRLEGKDDQEFIFFITRDSKGDWEAEFTPIF